MSGVSAYSGSTGQLLLYFVCPTVNSNMDATMESLQMNMCPPSLYYVLFISLHFLFSLRMPWARHKQHGDRIRTEK